MGSLAALLCATGLALFAQDYRGEAVPRNTAAPRASSISFSRFRLQSFAFGREGPTNVALRAAPVAGREYFAEADVYGIEGVASLRFELTDAAGRTLQTLAFWKSTDSSTDGEFFGFVTAPAQSFRVAAVGTALNGASFRALVPNQIQHVP